MTEAEMDARLSALGGIVAKLEKSQRDTLARISQSLDQIEPKLREASDALGLDEPDEGDSTEDDADSDWQSFVDNHPELKPGTADVHGRRTSRRSRGGHQAVEGVPGLAGMGD